MKKMLAALVLLSASTVPSFAADAKAGKAAYDKIVQILPRSEWYAEPGHSQDDEGGDERPELIGCSIYE